ncbi:MAG: type II toxin-antitoxin system VapC family toxin [Candidatus Woesearchaeota archaeon]
MIVDTTFLIDLLNGKKDALEFSKNNYFATTSISVFEIMLGMKKSEEIQTKGLFEEVQVLNFDQECAVLSANILKELKGKGLEIDFQDCMIASICLKHKSVLVTKNLKHFQRIKNLDVISY